MSLNGHWLTLTIFTPFAGVLLLMIPGLSDRAYKFIALGVSLLTFLVAAGMYMHFKTGTPGFQLVEDTSWMQSLNLRYTVGVDGISLFMVMLTAIFMPVAILTSWSVTNRIRMYMVATLFIETAILGTFLSLNLLMFFFFFELLLFPMYLIIGVWGSANRVYAAVKFFLFTMFGSAFLLVGILALYIVSGHTLAHASFDIRQLQGLPLAVSTGRWLFLAFFIGFAVKVPIIPFHTWLPDAHTEAPTKGSIVLAALLLKTGTYGLIRFNLTLFPDASHTFAIAISVLAVLGIIYGGIVAMMQTDLKRLIAYSSVSHLGLMVLGIFAFSNIALSGSVLQMLNHGLSTGLLFIAVGMLYERTHTRQISDLGGVAKVTPWLAGVFLFAALSSLGLPGLNNFVGEFLVILGTIGTRMVFGILASVGIVLSAIYLLWAYQRAYQGGTPDKWLHLPDINLREVLLATPIIIAIVAIGVFPKPFLDRINPSTDRVVYQVQHSGTTPSSSPAPASGSTLAQSGRGSAP